MIVVDTNVLAYAALVGERTELVFRLSELDSDWVAPPLWRHELANVLATRVRSTDRWALSIPEAIEAFANVERLVTDAALDASLGDRLEVVRRGGVSAYDAEFVVLAEQLNLPLVTNDRRLVSAFPRRAVALAEFTASA